MRIRVVVVVVAALASVQAAGALTANVPTAGVIHIWVEAATSGATSPIVITGAIGDSGTATSETKSGKVDSSGDYVKVVLKRGTFMINSVELDQIGNKAQPVGSQATCSAFVQVTGPVTLYRGTGAYAGISGTLEVTEVFAFVGPRDASGACNTSNSAVPVASFSTITGAGIVKFG
jgi:hypothetical protein